MANMMNSVETIIGIIIGIIVMLAFVNVGATEAQTQGDELTDAGYCANAGCYYNTTDTTCYNSQALQNESCSSSSPQSVPLGGLFGGTGIIFLVIMGALLVGMIKFGRSGFKK